MSKVTSPTEKKRIAYERDHYNDNGESDKAWRRAKPLKKAKARRAFRKVCNDALHVCGAEPETAPVNAERKQGNIQQRPVVDRGAASLPEFVATRRVRNQANTGARNARRARRTSA